jgi:hypothetical protein
MAIQEGAMLGGYLIPEEQFKQVIKEYLLTNDESVQQIKKIINNSLNNIKQKNIRALYKNIEKLEVEVLKNPPTSLMVITNLNSDNKNYKWYLQQSEKKTILKSGNLSKIKALEKEIQSQELSKILSDHLYNMIQTIENGNILNLQKFFKKYNFISKERKSQLGINASTSSYNMKKVIYGDNPNYLGQIADAFLNHLGNCHKMIFMSNFNTPIEIKQSVEEEEGENFLQLLIDSTNNVGWWTGGDLILLGVNNEVIANIQLKTQSLDSKNFNAEISYSRLGNELLNLKLLFEKNNIKDIEKFTNNFFNLFKTSGITEQAFEIMKEDAQQRIIESVIKNIKGNNFVKVSIS